MRAKAVGVMFWGGRLEDGCWDYAISKNDEPISSRDVCQLATILGTLLKIAWYLTRIY